MSDRTGLGLVGPSRGNNSALPRSLFLGSECVGRGIMEGEGREEGETSEDSERPRAPEGVCLLPPSLAASHWVSFRNHVGHEDMPYPIAAQGSWRDLRQTVTFAGTLDREREG